tara:strand:- start:752 stop:1912 length:1161 start_codon:yes stop_codon:yes gene_type:complete
MAIGSEKIISPTDQITTKTLLHEAIPLTGTIVSGTYDDNNIKNYAHGMFQSVFDYPYLSSSANHIFDITMGYSAQSAFNVTSNNMNTKKLNVYNQMAQVLYGFEFNGNTNTPSIRRFDSDGDLVGTTNDKMDECYFISFSRLLVKDEIKKGSFSMQLGVGSGSAGTVFNTNGTIHSGSLFIKDTGADTSFKVNSPVGEYGILYATSAGPAVLQNESAKCGLIFYQAGVMVLTASIFSRATSSSDAGGLLNTTRYAAAEQPVVHPIFTGPAANKTVKEAFSLGSISGSCDALRARIMNVSFNNTIELNSTIFFCRVEHSEFNYSSNPTYLSASQIVVKTDSTDTPVSYITGVGLYDSNDNLMAVGKLSEPLRKDPTIEYTLRARLDY